MLLFRMSKDGKKRTSKPAVPTWQSLAEIVVHGVRVLLVTDWNPVAADRRVVAPAKLEQPLWTWQRGCTRAMRAAVAC